jgi:hypothetical protein
MEPAHPPEGITSTRISREGRGPLSAAPRNSRAACGKYCRSTAHSTGVSVRPCCEPFARPCCPVAHPSRKTCPVAHPPSPVAHSSRKTCPVAHPPSPVAHPSRKTCPVAHPPSPVAHPSRKTQPTLYHAVGNNIAHPTARTIFTTSRKTPRNGRLPLRLASWRCR